MHVPYQDILRKASEVDEPGQLLAMGRELCSRLGFEIFSLSGISDRPDGTVRFRSVAHIPPTYSSRFHDLDRGKTDPVMQHCKRVSTPLCWDQDFYVGRGSGERWEVNAGYGLTSGVALAIHLPAGKHLFAGFCRSGPTPQKTDFDEVLVNLQVFANSVVQPVLALLCEDCPSQPPLDLSGRELECLKWAAEGKTAYETAVILGLSQSRISQVLSSALRKLGCVNKQQAIVKAIRSQLV